MLVAIRATNEVTMSMARAEVFDMARRNGLSMAELGARGGRKAAAVRRRKCAAIAAAAAMEDRRRNFVAPDYFFR